MSLREAGKERRSKRVLDAARDILAHGGIEALQMRALADEAQLSVRTVYNRFGSKNDVVAALMRDAIASLSSDLDALALEDPIDRSRAIITVSIRQFTTREAWMRPLLAAALSVRPDATRATSFHRARALQEEALGAAIEKRMLLPATSPDLLAHQVLSSYSQAALVWSHGITSAADFEAQALHAWACLLLGFARGATHTRMLEELDAQTEPMAAVARRAAAGPRRATA